MRYELGRRTERESGMGRWRKSDGELVRGGTSRMRSGHRQRALRLQASEGKQALVPNDCTVILESNSSLARVLAGRGHRSRSSSASGRQDAETSFAGVSIHKPENHPLFIPINPYLVIRCSGSPSPAVRISTYIRAHHHVSHPHERQLQPATHPHVHRSLCNYRSGRDGESIT